MNSDPNPPEQENPYTAPQSALRIPVANTVGEQALASRWLRLAAYLLDMVVMWFVVAICVAIVVVIVLMTGGWEHLLSRLEGLDSMDESELEAQLESMLGFQLIFMVLSTLLSFLAFAIINYPFLRKNGQTIGKRLVNIRMVGMDGQLKSPLHILFIRYLPFYLVGLIPFIGLIIGLANYLFIFRQDKRCIHDLVAGTQVETT